MFYPRAKRERNFFELTKATREFLNNNDDFVKNVSRLAKLRLVDLETSFPVQVNIDYPSMHVYVANHCYVGMFIICPKAIFKEFDNNPRKFTGKNKKTYFITI